MSLNLARFLTMNAQVLKSLPVEEVLKIHPLINPTRLEWRRAAKTKPLRAKPIDTIITDPSVMDRFFLATLEGHETVRPHAFVCIGVTGDIWQQTEAKLYAKYSPGPTDANGWQVMEPKPGLTANFAQVGDSSVQALGEFAGFSVRGTWGDERIIDDEKVYLQYGVAGDWIGMGLDREGRDDPVDIYRVARKIFENTYDLV